MDTNNAQLFSLVKEVYNEKLWEDYWDSDMLAIQLPGADEPIFVSILGKMEDNYGVLIYRNEKELAYLFETLASMEEQDSFQLLLLQSCLAIHYEDRETMEREEYEKVKASGIPFRGKKAWPVLTDFRPGYYPAAPSAEELDWLADALKKVLQTAKDFRSKLDFYENEEYDFQFLLREYGEDGTVRDGLYDVPEEILQGLSPDLLGRQPILVSTFEMMRAKQTPLKPVSWEMDLEQVDIPVVIEEESDERAFFPSIWMVVDPKERIILQTDVVKEDELETLQRKFIQLVLSADIRPSELMIEADKEPQITAYFWEMLHELGIRLTVVEQLPIISSVKMQLDDFPPEWE